MVGHCVFGLFIFKGGQIDFHPKTSSAPICHFPWKPSSGLNVMNCIQSVHLNCFLLKMVTPQRFPWKPWGLFVAYTFCDLGFSASSGHSFSQVHGLYHHSVLAPRQNLLLSLISTPQHHGLHLEFWDALSSHGVTLALWPLSSSLPQPQDGTANVLHSFPQSFNQH